MKVISRGRIAAAVPRARLGDLRFGVDKGRWPWRGRARDSFGEP